MTRLREIRGDGKTRLLSFAGSEKLALVTGDAHLIEEARASVNRMRKTCPAETETVGL